MSTQPVVAPRRRTDDFMPLHGIDHVELYVGNALQAAYFYVARARVPEVAYAGLETGVRDRASHVLEQGRIRLVLTGALTPDHEIGRHVARHGDGVKVIALSVPDVEHAYREAIAARRRGRARAVRGAPTSTARSASRRSRPTARRCTRSSTARDYGRVPPRLRRRATRRPATSACSRIDHIVGNVELGEMDDVGQVLRGRLRDARDAPLHRRGHLDRVLRADVEGGHERQRARQVPDQRAGRGQAQVADRRVPRVLRRRRRAAHRGRDARHRRDASSELQRARDRVPAHARDLLRRRAGAGRRDQGGRRGPAPARASSSTATTRATCCRSSPSRSATGRRCSSRSSSATARAASARATSRRCSRRSSASRSCAGTSRAMRYHSLGQDPAEAPRAVPRPRGAPANGKAPLLVEEVMGFEGFSGNESILYHLCSPCRVKDVGEFDADRARGVGARDARAPAHEHARARADGRPVLGRRVLQYNNDVEIGICVPEARRTTSTATARATRSSSSTRARASSRRSSATLPVPPARLRRDPARDDLPLPLRRAAALADASTRRARSRRPNRYRNRYGQLLEHAPFSQRDFHPPAELRHAPRPRRARGQGARARRLPGLRRSTTTRSTSSAGTATSTRTRSTSPTSSPRPAACTSRRRRTRRSRARTS